MQARQLVPNNANVDGDAMESKAKFEAEVLELLSQLDAKKQALQARHAHELEEINKEIDAVAITARLLRQPPTSASPTLTIQVKSAGDLRGKSARVACIEIANANRGIVKVAAAKEALIAAGILKNNKNAWGALYTTLTRSKDFEKGPTPGTFKLVNWPAQGQGTLLQ
jgi:hypothetical protein